MKKLLEKFRGAAARWRDRNFEALGYVPESELEALREAYDDELNERLSLKRDYDNLQEDYQKALKISARRSSYTITPCIARAHISMLAQHESMGGHAGEAHQGRAQGVADACD